MPNQAQRAVVAPLHLSRAGSSHINLGIPARHAKPSLPCRFFLAGNCSNAGCTFVHAMPTQVREDVGQADPCRLYMAGNCSKADSCNFQHIAAAASNVMRVGKPEICKFFINGNCTKGANCQFLHDPDSAASNVMRVGKPEICKFFINGNCTKGANCPFLHDPDSVVANVMRVGEPEICKFFINGNCTKGANCPFLHAPDSVVATTSQNVDDLDFVPFAGASKVKLGPGFKVLKIETATEFTCLAVDHVPESLLSVESVGRILDAFPAYENFRISNGKVLVYYAHLHVAEAVRDTLDGSYLEDVDVSDPLVAYIQVKPNTGKILDSALKVSWFKPTASAHVVFQRAHEVKYAIKLFNGYNFKQNTLVCTEVSSKRNAREGSVFVQNLPHFASKNDIVSILQKRNLEAYAKVSFHYPPFRASDAKKRIHDELSIYGTLKSFEVQPFNAQSKKSKALAIFSARQESEAAFASLNGKSVKSLGNARLFFEPLLSTKLMYPAMIHPFIKAKIKQCLLGCRGVNGAVNQNTDKLVQVKLNSNSKEELATAIGKVKREIAGKALISDSQGSLFWDPYFVTKGGMALLNQIGLEFDSLLYRDCRNHSISFYCKADDPKLVSMVMSTLIKRLEDYQQSQKVLKLTRKEFQKVFSFGIKQLAELSRAESIAFDIVTCEARVVGADSSVAFVKSWCKESNEISVSALRLAETEDSITCAVCFCDYGPDEVITLSSCQHNFCRDCFANYMNHAEMGNKFPMVCVSEGCDVPIAISTVHQNVSAELYLQLAKSSLTAYISSNSDVYQFCVTADCPQVYQRDTGVVVCDCCETSICTSCRTNMHEGLTCTEFKLYESDPAEAALALWKKQNDVRECPSQGCQAAIEKNGGCNHMTCGSCGAHICWVCMGVYESSAIYKHMREKHGGIYDRGLIYDQEL
jgi:IBR domain, a half RING-finger domain/Zinc finger domain/RNA-binding, Nab2-type zinc finger